MMIDLNTWAYRLERLAGPVLTSVSARAVADPEGLLASFSDEQSQRRAVDRPLLAHVLDLDPGPPPGSEDGTGVTADVALWWALHARSWDDGLLPPMGSPLLVHREGTTLEVWTEAELSAMHALFSIGRVFQRPDLSERALQAAMWHMEHTQPDNATNHAWGVHVFLMCAVRSGRPEGDLLAQTLVHNCCVGTGEPDVFSACLLAHAARELRAAVNTTPAARS